MQGNYSCSNDPEESQNLMRSKLDLDPSSDIFSGKSNQYRVTDHLTKLISSTLDQESGMLNLCSSRFIYLFFFFFVLLLTNRIL